VYVLKALTEEQIVELLHRALKDKEQGLGGLNLEADEHALRKIAAYSSGDARSAYNALEVAATLASAAKSRITESVATDALQKRVLMYDKAGEEHYNLISALHKSVRNSDPDAALYWLARMLEAGEDGLYIARRLVRMASEDIGLADPNALAITLAARDAYDFLGMPEGDLALAQAVVYLCAAPKSNALYTAFGAVHDDVEHTAQDPVPLHLRNAPTGLMKNLGYAKGYQYAHDLQEKVANMECLPDNLRGRRYYHPTEEGIEKRIKTRLDEIRQLKGKIHHGDAESTEKSKSQNKSKG
jgi:putative ATPase